MTPARARELVTLSMLGTAGVVTIGSIAQGDGPPAPRRFLALGVVFVGLAGLSGFVPEVAVPFALVVLAGALLAEGVPAAQAVTEGVRREGGLTSSDARPLATTPASGAGSGSPGGAGPAPAQPGGGGAPSGDLAGASGTYGFPSGPVDSGRVLAGGIGGDWAGSMPRALFLARLVGSTPSSQKRSRVRTANGSVSDHYVGNVNSYAVDLPFDGYSTAGRAAGNVAFGLIMAALGRPGAKPGVWHNVTVGGFQYNVGWLADADHMNHIHIGVTRV